MHKTWLPQTCSTCQWHEWLVGYFVLTHQTFVCMGTKGLAAADLQRQAVRASGLECLALYQQLFACIQSFLYPKMYLEMCKCINICYLCIGTGLGCCRPAAAGSARPYQWSPRFAHDCYPQVNGNTTSVSTWLYLLERGLAQTNDRKVCRAAQ